MANELAQNIEVQERLQKEIDETIEKHGKKVSYEGLMDMKYLDMVINGSYAQKLHLHRFKNCFY